ncbi:hypothetical protein R1sor_004099 [Riccia sorocarpa]|uniref:Uncharacterized protein n=1 Tax=Riccia sorocarpa TaxID=122646 RepID=A0ABD3H6C7_9MARC
MNAVSVNNRTAQGQSDLEAVALSRRGGMSGAVDRSLEEENKENSPMLLHTSVQEGTILRPFPRLPLHDITHLFPFNSRGQSKENASGTAGVTDRRRRRSAESALPSKKRKICNMESDIRHGLLKPEPKCKRASSCLRSFR